MQLFRLTALLVLLSATVAVGQTKHTYTNLYAAGNTAIFVDTTTMMATDAGYSAWTLWVVYPEEKTKLGSKAYNLTKDIYNCSEKTIDHKYVASYDINGNSLYAGTSFGTPEEQIPDSLGEMVVSKVCKGPSGLNYRPFDSLTAAVNFARGALGDPAKKLTPVQGSR